MSWVCAVAAKTRIAKINATSKRAHFIGGFLPRNDIRPSVPGRIIPNFAIQENESLVAGSREITGRDLFGSTRFKPADHDAQLSGILALGTSHDKGLAIGRDVVARDGSSRVEFAVE